LVSQSQGSLHAMEPVTKESAALLNPHMRLLLAELDKRFAKMDAKWEDRVAAVERRQDANDMGWQSMLQNVGQEVYHQMTEFQSLATGSRAASDAEMATRVGVLE
jgi:hypothetical protein